MDEMKNDQLYIEKDVMMNFLRKIKRALSRQFEYEVYTDKLLMRELWFSKKKWFISSAMISEIRPVLSPVKGYAPTLQCPKLTDRHPQRKQFHVCRIDLTAGGDWIKVIVIYQPTNPDLVCIDQAGPGQPLRRVVFLKHTSELETER